MQLPCAATYCHCF